MARRIRRRKVSHSARSRKNEPVRPAVTLPEAKPMPATRVLIAAPGPMRTVLTSKISSSTEVSLAGVAENEMTAVEKVVTEEADVAAIYIHLGGQLAGLDIARNVSKACPQAGILVMVNDLAGVDVRKHSRMFGMAWSYAVAENAQTDSRFADLVQSVGRGIHWIDPELRRVLEAIWKIAEDGRDLEADSGAQTDSDTSEPPPRPRGIQTMAAGNSGIGTGVSGVSSTTDPQVPDEYLDDEEEEEDAPKPRGIQTMSTGRGGIGSDGFGVSKTG